MDWNHFELIVVDAFTPDAEQLWRTEGPDDVEGWRDYLAKRHRILSAIELAAQAAWVAKIDIAPLLWLRRYIYGELPLDVNRVAAVKDFIRQLD